MDWLDTKGKIIGQIDKTFAHAHGLLHPAVHVFVLDQEGKLILQYRTRSKKIYPQHWDTSVGGHVHAGEDLLKGAQREAGEELGIGKMPLHYLGWADVEDTETNSKGKFHHRERVHYHLARLKKGMRIHPNEEFENIAHIPLEEMPEFIRKKRFTATFLAGWRKFGKAIQGKG